ncbi:defective in cullin neddylation protein AAR3 isoform X1 [Cryptomeria japonica]|uniref:defective in cullin neddylation protein AAR3 isoform X1 n=1 Tax=Cryptomeria japonica TaxID=3369 RepID=UPI0027D9DB2E|nr:defective in cullin neddylation protein AAR3 isoform X1 [Cryptomeria japonica]XP_059068115.1 defective in cullin neddylation protein AAR3 isoform X1 [Cryptomeria japonica]
MSNFMGSPDEQGSPVDSDVAVRRMTTLFEEFCRVLCHNGTRAAKAIISGDVLQDLKGQNALFGLYSLKSLLDKNQHLMIDSSRFRCFYYFVFFMCCENGQRSLAVNTSIEAWRLVFSGRYRLLDQWCDFVQKNQRHSISEDTWRGLLDFTRSVPENLEGYDIEAGAWPLLIDEFVNHMYRKSGQNNNTNVLPGLMLSSGNKRRSSSGTETEIHSINCTSEKPEEFPDPLRSKRVCLWKGQIRNSSSVLSGLH